MPSQKFRALVIWLKGRGTDIDSLVGQINASGCSATTTRSLSGSIDSSMGSAEVLVVLICEQSLTDASVDQAIAVARNQNKRIVGVWAKDMKDERFPHGINRAASAVICFRIQDIKRAICGDEDFWQSPDCEPRSPPKTPRHKK